MPKLPGVRFERYKEEQEKKNAEESKILIYKQEHKEKKENVLPVCEEVLYSRTRGGAVVTLCARR